MCSKVYQAGVFAAIKRLAGQRFRSLSLSAVSPNRLSRIPKSNPTERSTMLAALYKPRMAMARVDLKHLLNRLDYSRCAVFCQPRQKEVSMLKLKHLGAAVIAAALASAIVVDTADARRGGGGGGGMRAGGFGGGGGFRGGGMRAGGFAGGGLRTASFNRGGFAGNRFANAGFARRADFGRPGRPGWGWGGGGWGGRGWGWGGGWAGNNWGWGWGAAALGTGLAFAASSSYCDPYYDYYGNCGYGYGSYGSYAPAFGFGAYRPFARPWRARWWW
jgi:hypothetical protein